MPEREPPPLPPIRQDRLISLFLLAVVAFNPPLMRVFGIEATLFGWPLLALYLFGVWFGLIVLLALQVERHAAVAGREEPPGSGG